MSTHVELGKEGEAMAEKFLSSKGFTILHRNWRYSHYEIDLIALKNGIPHFVEVKMRSSSKFGWPEQNVTKKKIRDLLQAAEQFLYKHRQYRNFRLDVLSIVAHPKGETEYFFMEDVYL